MAKKLNPLTGMLEDDGMPEDMSRPPDAPPTTPMVSEAGAGGAAPVSDPSAAMKAAAPGAKPTDVLAAAANAAPALESRQVTTKSPTTTATVETKALKEAAKNADDAAGRERQATVDKLEAERALEAKAIEADQARQVQEWEQAKKLEDMKRAAMDQQKPGE